MCNIPDDVRKAIQTCANYTSTSLALHNSYFVTQRWLDSLPTAPEPDWGKAPEGMQWWAVESDELAYWYIQEPVDDGSGWSNDEDDFEPDQNIGCDWQQTLLPIGCDWRCTLRKRPETDVSELERQLMPAVPEQEIGEWLE